MSIVEGILRGDEKVSVLRGESGSMRISPLDTSNAPYDHFQIVADDAIAEAEAEGRDVKPHTSSRDSLPGYDFVDIGPNP
jgi:hypothetical protein